MAAPTLSSVRPDLNRRENALAKLDGGPGAASGPTTWAKWQERDKAATARLEAYKPPAATTPISQPNPPPAQQPSVSPLAGVAKLLVPVDTVVLAGEKTADIIVRLQEPLRRQVGWDWGTSNGNVYAPTYFPVQGGTLVFVPGETEKIVQVKINRLAPGEFFNVHFSHSRNQPPITGTPVAKVIGGTARITPPPNPHPGATFRSPALKTGRALGFVSNFKEPVVPNEVGGSWQSQPFYGRIIGNNELGVMAHASQVPGINPHYRDANDDFVLRAARAPHQIKEGPLLYDYHGAMVTGLKIPASHVREGFVRVIAKLDLSPGSTFAFWLMPIGRNWPPELDITEIGLGGTPAAPNFEFVTTTHGSYGAEGYRVPLKINGDGQFHEIACDLTDAEIVTLVDGVIVHRKPNPHPGVTWYPILDISVGGITFAPPADPLWSSEATLWSFEVWK